MRAPRARAARPTHEFNASLGQHPARSRSRPPPGLFRFTICSHSFINRNILGEHLRAALSRIPREPTPNLADCVNFLMSSSLTARDGKRVAHRVGAFFLPKDGPCRCERSDLPVSCQWISCRVLLPVASASRGHFCFDVRRSLRVGVLATVGLVIAKLQW